MVEIDKDTEIEMNDALVLAYLEANPEFWTKNGSKLIPEKDKDVLDFQKVMFEKMRENSKQDKMEKKALMDLGQANFVTFKRIQDCILSALASENMAELIDVIYRDWAILLELDLIVIAIETEMKDTLPLRGMTFLENGAVENYLNGKDLYIESTGTNKEIFGSRAELINSFALVRLPLGENKPNALVGFGVSQAETFDYSHGSHSIIFLCNALGYIVRRWLVLS